MSYSERRRQRAKNTIEIKAIEQALVPGISTEDFICTRMSGDVSKVSPTEIEAENAVESQDMHCTNDENQIDTTCSTKMCVCRKSNG